MEVILDLMLFPDAQSELFCRCCSSILTPAGPSFGAAAAPSAAGAGAGAGAGANTPDVRPTVAERCWYMAMLLAVMDHEATSLSRLVAALLECLILAFIAPSWAKYTCSSDPLLELNYCKGQCPKDVDRAHK